MLDIETLGTSSQAVVLSAGLVAFNKDAILAQREWHLDVDQQVNQGRRMDFATLKWWMTQSPTAKEIFNVNHRSPLIAFSGEFNQMCEEHKDAMIWGNGASFDVPIIETLLKKNLSNGFNGHASLPWKHWSIRCYRTVNKMFDIQKGIPFEGIKHGALPDAVYQAKCLQKFFIEHPELEK